MLLNNGKKGVRNKVKKWPTNKVEVALKLYLVLDIFHKRYKKNLGLKNLPAKLLTADSLTICHCLQIVCNKLKEQIKSEFRFIKNEFNWVVLWFMSEKFSSDAVMLWCCVAPIGHKLMINEWDLSQWQTDMSNSIGQNNLFYWSSRSTSCINEINCQNLLSPEHGSVVLANVLANFSESLGCCRNFFISGVILWIVNLDVV